MGVNEGTKALRLRLRFHFQFVSLITKTFLLPTPPTFPSPAPILSPSLPFPSFSLPSRVSLIQSNICPAQRKQSHRNSAFRYVSPACPAMPSSPSLFFFFWVELAQAHSLCMGHAHCYSTVVRLYLTINCWFYVLKWRRLPRTLPANAFDLISSGRVSCGWHNVDRL